jgi:hypothetical protein
VHTRFLVARLFVGAVAGNGSEFYQDAGIRSTMAGSTHRSIVKDTKTTYYGLSSSSSSSSSSSLAAGGGGGGAADGGGGSGGGGGGGSALPRQRIDFLRTSRAHRIADFRDFAKKEIPALKSAG